MTTLGVLIGRFQPAHLGHVHILKEMLAECDYVLVLLGSSLRSRDLKNPLRWYERAVIIRDSLIDQGVDSSRLLTLPIKDYPYTNNRWQYQVQKIVEEQARSVEADNIVLYGNDKDNSSWYLKLFPQWERRRTSMIELGGMLNATDVRELLLQGKDPIESGIITPTAAQVMRDWRTTEEGARLIEEYAWVKENFWDLYSKLPYGIIFQTVDTVITWRSMVLLGKRRDKPGQGLWALPGGYVNNREWIAQASIRELDEETRIKVYFNTRAGQHHLELDPSWMVDSKTYDWPDRSPPRRIVTTAFHWRIPDHLEILHEPNDDLQCTKFFPIRDVVEAMDYQIFADHQMIINDMLLKY